MAWPSTTATRCRISPSRPTTHNDARQHPRPGLLRGLGLYSLRLDRSQACFCIRSPLLAEMVFQRRNEQLGAEHALEGGHGHSMPLGLGGCQERTLTLYAGRDSWYRR